MQQQEQAIRAVIDIGSNTIEILIARCLPGDLEILEHQTTMARLGESVDESGEVSHDKFALTIDALRRYQELAQQHGAGQIIALATEALREARNSQDLLDAIKRETGIEVQLISGLAEAVLDYYGTTYGSDAHADTGVLDVGGGSTEIILAKHRRITWLTSIPIGSGAIHDRYLPSDPPADEEMKAAGSYLAQYIPTTAIPETPPTLIVTGSSASSLLKLAKNAFKLDDHDEHLTIEDLTRCEGLLSALPAEEIARRFEQRPERARILAGGVLIIQAMMQYFHLNEVRVSSHGVREGALLAYTRYGDHWLEEVNGIASQHGGISTDQGNQDAQDKQEQPFAEYGQDILPTYVKKFLKWSDDIREQEDSEAVHKMRVASRRLRAALEAFESATDTSEFKKINRRVKKLADQLGIVRDTDVMIAGLRAEQQAAPDEAQPAGLQWLIDQLEAYHTQEQQILKTELQSLDEEALKQQVDSCIVKGAEHYGKS